MRHHTTARSRHPVHAARRTGGLTLGIASTYPPREDGIATFTRDLLAAVCAADPTISAHLVAITDPGAHYAYPPEVRGEIEQDNPESYARAGWALARASVDVVSVQHEFGLWGAPGYLAEPFERHDCVPAFLAALDMPVVTTLHTVLPQAPTGRHRGQCPRGRSADPSP